MTFLLPFQLCGDVMKMACYPLQMALVSRRRVTAYIAQAIGAPVAYAALTYLWLPVFGVKAAPLAYAAAYGGAFVALLFSLRSTLLAPAVTVAAAEREQLAV
jgi:hypothetical protein